MNLSYQSSLISFAYGEIPHCGAKQNYCFTQKNEPRTKSSHWSTRPSITNGVSTLTRCWSGQPLVVHRLLRTIMGIHSSRFSFDMKPTEFRGIDKNVNKMDVHAFMSRLNCKITKNADNLYLTTRVFRIFHSNDNNKHWSQLHRVYSPVCTYAIFLYIEAWSPCVAESNEASAWVDEMNGRTPSWLIGTAKASYEICLHAMRYERVNVLKSLHEVFWPQRLWQAMC